MPNIPLAYAHQPLTSISGLAASAVRMATYIRLTECKSVPRSHNPSIASADPIVQTDQVLQPMGIVSLFTPNIQTHWSILPHSDFLKQWKTRKLSSGLI